MVKESRVDDILDIIDGGLQSSNEYGYGADSFGGAAIDQQTCVGDGCGNQPKQDLSFCQDCLEELRSEEQRPQRNSCGMTWQRITCDGTNDDGNHTARFEHLDNEGNPDGNPQWVAVGDITFTIPEESREAMLQMYDAIAAASHWNQQEIRRYYVYSRQIDERSGIQPFWRDPRPVTTLEEASFAVWYMFEEHGMPTDIDWQPQLRPHLAARVEGQVFEVKIPNDDVCDMIVELTPGGGWYNRETLMRPADRAFGSACFRPGIPETVWTFERPHQPLAIHRWRKLITP